MNWKVGDRAVILKSSKPYMIGTKVKIMSDLVIIDKHEVYGSNAAVHYVDVPRPHYNRGMASYLPENLGPIPDKYDGREVSVWSECPWQPEVVRV